MMTSRGGAGAKNARKSDSLYLAPRICLRSSFSRWPRLYLSWVLVVFLLTACEFSFGQSSLPTAVPTVPLASNLSTETESLPTVTAEPVEVEVIATKLVVPPTRPATAVPQPTPTYSADIADWTVLVYLDADNSLELPGLLDINEMEAAGSSDEVNVVVQMDRAVGETAGQEDWQTTRRYLITPDDDPSTIGSNMIADLGEINMGSPEALSDFLTWGMRAFPANQYALVMWDHGAGWNGIAFDSDDGVQNGRDHISLSELEYSLAKSLDSANVDKFDVIGFDACLMGQLDVFQAIQPYADFAVGSEELTPGQGWDYRRLLGHLYANPEQNGRSLANQMVTDFMDYYRFEEPDDFVTMSAVDLLFLPNVAHKVEVLAAHLQAESSFVASAVGDARSGTEAYARVYADKFEEYAAIDLHHFASILAQRNVDEMITEAASEVMLAVETAVIANERGSGLKHSQGIALYFPRNARFYAANYAQTTKLTQWNDFLTDYHKVSGEAATLPEVQIVNTFSGNSDEGIGLQRPFFVEWEIVGRDIENAVLLGGLYQEDGRRRLLEYDNLIPEPTYLPDGSELLEWRDGVHEDFFIWDTQVTYLYDSSGAGGFIIMWPTTNQVLGDLDNKLFSVPGRFRRAGEEIYHKANVVFDQRSGQLFRVWSNEAGAAAAEILPQTGDEFQLYDYFLDANDGIVRELGGSLFFDEAGQLYFDWRPLPNGRYFLGFRAENVAGQSDIALTDVAVDNSSNLPDLQAYLDPYLGFQFRYPTDWYAPRYDGALLYTANISGTTSAQIKIFPDSAPDDDAASVKQQMLATFGAVGRLYEDEVDVNGRLGLRTAYGYTDADGQSHTGVLVTFVRDGFGFAIDVDGLEAEEERTLTAVSGIVASWTNTPVGIGLQPGNWARLDLDSFTVPQPADFVPAQWGDWEAFELGGNDQTYVALRVNPAEFSDDQVLQSLVESAADQEAFVATPPFRTLIGSAVWQRADFSYRDSSGDEIWGFIMVRIEGDQELVAFAEAPRQIYNDLEAQVFLVMIAGLTLK
ncbi:MAG: clostripain-related cysteine peptidase [Chloroflexota bacterium]